MIIRALIGFKKDYLRRALSNDGTCEARICDYDCDGTEWLQFRNKRPSEENWSEQWKLEELEAFSVIQYYKDWKSESPYKAVTVETKDVPKYFNSIEKEF